MADMDSIWFEALEIFPILKNEITCEPVARKRVDEVNGKLAQLGMGKVVHETVLFEVQSRLYSHVVPNFWKALELLPSLLDGSVADSSLSSSSILGTKADIQSQYPLFRTFLAAVEELHRNYVNMKEMHLRCQVTDVGTGSMATDDFGFDEMMQSSLLSQLPMDFNKTITFLYDVSFKVFIKKQLGDEKNSDDNMDDCTNGPLCTVCGTESKVSCLCHDLNKIFNQINVILKNMQLLDRIIGQSLTTLIKKHILTHVRETVHGIFSRSHLTTLKKWLDDVVILWLTQIYNNGNLKVDEQELATFIVIQEFKVKLTYFLYETYANILIEQFFNIIIEFPDSMLVISDLKICLEMIDLRKHLISTLKESLRSRLLHAGVNTMDILTGYVAAIKAIRYLDSSGIILDAVMNPIKEYLRNRCDTVRKVVTELTEDGPTDLADELAKGESLKENMYTSGGREDLSNWESWHPDPVEAYSSAVTKGSRSADIISMIVNIYGSKDLFVNEYRNLLADRLLTRLDFNPEKEIRNIELLKLRFGENLLHSCEVMLKDISDSKRINAHIHNIVSYRIGRQLDIKSLIISTQFWPAFNKETLELPPEINDEFALYTKCYEAYKGNRTLNWRHVTGRVSIEIELSDRTLNMTVSPTQAVILYHFQKNNKWLLDDLSNVIKVPPSLLRRKIIFWLNHGIIREVKPDVYEIVEETDQKSPAEKTQPVDNIDDECETAMASASDQRQEELQIFWSYIVGMLTNLDSLPLERIHQMLKLFASHGPGIEFTRDELKSFLQSKVRDHKLICKGGAFQLAK